MDEIKPREPDLSKDRFLVITGGCIPRCFTMPQLLKIRTFIPAAFSLAPVEPEPEGVFPHTHQARVMLDAQLGTIDELTTLYREQLTKAVHYLLALDRPETDEFRKQLAVENEHYQQKLLEHGFDKPTKADEIPDKLLYAYDNDDVGKIRNQRKEEFIKKADLPPSELTTAERETIRNLLFAAADRFERVSDDKSAGLSLTGADPVALAHKLLQYATDKKAGYPD